MTGIIFNRDATIDRRSYRKNEFAEADDAKARRLVGDGTARYAAGVVARRAAPEIRILDSARAPGRGPGPSAETRG